MGHSLPRHPPPPPKKISVYRQGTGTHSVRNCKLFWRTSKPYSEPKDTREWSERSWLDRESGHLSQLCLLQQSQKWYTIISTISCWSCCCCLVAKLCLTLHNLMDCSAPGSSVHGIFQARMLEWVGISFSRGSYTPSLVECGRGLYKVVTLGK